MGLTAGVYGGGGDGNPRSSGGPGIELAFSPPEMLNEEMAGREPRTEAA